jgi:hypothetical protein
MQNISARIVPQNYGMAWVKVASKLVMINYPLTMAMVGINCAVSFISFRAGPVGGPLVGIVSTLLGPGVLVIVADYLKFQKSDINNLFIAFHDRELMKRMGPLAAFNFIATAITGVVWMTSPFAVLLLYILLLPITWFVTPLITFHKMTFRDALSPAIDAVIKNIKPLFILVVCSIALIVGFIFLLVLPLFFYGIPLFFMLGYPVYASIFLGLDIEALNQELKNRLNNTQPGTPP